IVSLVLLAPGLLLPMFHLEVRGSVKAQVANVEAEILNTTRSVLGTVEELWDRDRLLVAFLILFFSAIVPFIKGVLILMALGATPERGNRLYSFVSNISKWSM